MTQITIPSFKITVPSDMKESEIYRLYSDHHGYQTKVTDEVTGELINNPETRVEFTTRNQIRQFLEAVNNQQLKEAVEAVEIEEILPSN